MAWVVKSRLVTEALTTCYIMKRSLLVLMFHFFRPTSFSPLLAVRSQFCRYFVANLSLFSSWFFTVALSPQLLGSVHTESGFQTTTISIFANKICFSNFSHFNLVYLFLLCLFLILLFLTSLSSYCFFCYCFSLTTHLSPSLSSQPFTSYASALPCVRIG